jgi:hypothetical protein
MSEIAYDAPAENYSLSGAMFGAEAAPAFDDPGDFQYTEPPYDLEYDGEWEEPEDEFDIEDPMELTRLLAARAVAEGVEPLVALANARAAADEWWQERDERQAYEAHVAEQQWLANGDTRGWELVDEAAARHGLASNQAGHIRAGANALLDEARAEAYDRGDVAQFEWLSSPEGAVTAIDAAASRRRVENFAENAWAHNRGGGNGVFQPGRDDAHAEWASNQRAAFEAELPFTEHLRRMNGGRVR